MKAKKFPPKFASKVIRGEVALHFQQYIKNQFPDVESKQNYLIQPYVKGEGRPREALGIIQIQSRILVDINDITQDDAQAAGFADKWDLRRYFEKKLNNGKELPKYTCLWRIDWKVIQRNDGKPIPRTAAEKARDAELAAQIEAAGEVA